MFKYSLKLLGNMPEKQRPKFYNASSSEQFGKAWSTNIGTGTAKYRIDFTDGRIPGIADKAFQDEDTPFIPCSPYAIAKLAAHYLTKTYRESYGIFGCSGILFNHCSPRRGQAFVTKKITQYIAEMLLALKRKQKFSQIKTW